MPKDEIRLFKGDAVPVRREWDAENEKWWFSIVDVVGVLTEQVDSLKARKYWNKLKQRLSEEGNETVTNCHQLKMRAADGKLRLLMLLMIGLLALILCGCTTLAQEDSTDYLSLLEVHNSQEAAVRALLGNKLIAIEGWTDVSSEERAYLCTLEGSSWVLVAAFANKDGYSATEVAANGTSGILDSVGISGDFPSGEKVSVDVFFDEEGRVREVAWL